MDYYLQKIEFYMNKKNINLIKKEKRPESADNSSEQDGNYSDSASEDGS